jgi:DNA gyrase subunit A
MAEEDVRAMGRASRGVCGIKLTNADELAAMLRVSSDQKMFVLTEYGYGKRVEFDNFTAHGRATHGQIIYAPEEKTGEIVGAITVLDSDDVVVITSQGKTLKLPASTVSIQGKGAKGVRVLNIDRPDFVIGLDKIVREEDAEIFARAADEAPINVQETTEQVEDGDDGIDSVRPINTNEF